MSTPDATPSIALVAPRRLSMATLHLAGGQAVVSATLPLMIVLARLLDPF